MVVVVVMERGWRVPLWETPGLYLIQDLCKGASEPPFVHALPQPQTFVVYSSDFNGKGEVSKLAVEMPLTYHEAGCGGRSWWPTLC